MPTVLYPAIRLQQAKIIIYGTILSFLLFMVAPLLGDIALWAFGGLWVGAFLIMGYYQFTRSFRSVEIHADSFIVKRGIFTTTSDSIPFSKVTGIHVRRSMIQRLIGTASVGIDIVGPGIEFDVGTYSFTDAETIKKSLASIEAKL